MNSSGESPSISVETPRYFLRSTVTGNLIMILKIPLGFPAGILNETLEKIFDETDQYPSKLMMKF